MEAPYCALTKIARVLLPLASVVVVASNSQQPKPPAQYQIRLDSRELHPVSYQISGVYQFYPCWSICTLPPCAVLAADPFLLGSDSHSPLADHYFVDCIFCVFYERLRYSCVGSDRTKHGFLCSGAFALPLVDSLRGVLSSDARFIFMQTKLPSVDNSMKSYPKRTESALYVAKTGPSPRCCFFASLSCARHR